ncbi:MAG: tripartite tricarboxylate transporter TctB family protein [bacterium]
MLPGLFFSCLVLIQEIHIMYINNMHRSFKCKLLYIKNKKTIVQLLIIFSTFLYIIFLNYTGFILISIVYMYFNFNLLQYRHKILTPLLSIFIPILTYLFFGYMLKIPLPRSSLEESLLNILL